MKPNFALTLSFDGIGLLSRADAGWERVGEVPLDVPDLQAALKVLKESAGELGSEPLHSKLILPDEQIKYLTIVDPQGSDDIQTEAVRHALDGATPYSLDELAYDWASDGKMIHIAAVARETLAEAEGFAVSNGFAPLYFAAKPAQAAFGREPFFGQTQHYQDNESALGALETDNEVVTISGIARPPEVAPESQPEPELSEAEAKTAAPEPEVVKATPPETAAEPEAQPELESKPEPEPEPEPEPKPEPAAPAFSSRRTETDTGAAPALTGVTRNEPATTKPIVTEPTISGDENPPQPVATASSVPPPPTPVSESAVTAFFSRRSNKPDPSDEDDDNDVGTAPAGAGFSLQNLRRSEPVIVPPPPPNLVPPTASEQQRLTVFGARKKAEPAPQKPRAVGGKPRYLGLLLTAALLVFLVGVAAWASVFVDDGLSRFFIRSDTEFAASPDAPDETLIEGDEAGLPNGTLELASLDPDAVVPKNPQIMPLPVEPISDEEARVKYAVTGIWVLPPAAPQIPTIPGQDDLYVASIDPVIGSHDAVALPALDFDLADRGIAPQHNPAEAGKRFTLDARGLVVATAEGALSPEGHVVYLGKPPSLPAVWPAPVETAEATPEEPTDAETAALAHLASLRPKLRPTTLAESNERANLGGRSLKELAAIRPRLRPPSPQEIAAAQPQPTKPETPETLPPTPGAVVIPVPDPSVPKRDLDPNATPQAVARSVKPKPRPNNFARIVKRAERNAERNEQVTTVAAVAPKTVTPRIPSTASVAKQATVRNAINLKRVSLMGVYGKPSSRRALVRLANGRYKKVKVGDRLEGGRVSAIGEGELHYKKGNRNVTLKMPRG
ncbi:hypothetical protein KO498_16070 [Lentibacter algarum]|uniref:hypothetical protein n=1 Tax=Lentibacter algarum TaxID=576131 RepID=UPI001C0A3BF7|nr:hypothetical protein [Lentibacter algarum]MBU2983323.1 hypothetical protein [Lentibacter algarum]